MTTGARTTGRRAPLDGLRTVAIFAVFAFHCIQPDGGGFLGVDVFFVLSGYLMTSLIAREMATRGNVRYGRYLARRVRRLYPALVAAVLLALAVAWLAEAERVTIRQVLPSLLYVKDVFSLRGGLLDHTWSLSVEAQFYVVWPFVMALVLRSKRPGIVMWIATAASLPIVMAGALVASGHVVYYTPFGHLTTLLVGSAIALTPPLRGMLVPLALWMCGVGLLLLLAEPFRLVYTGGGEPGGMVIASALTGVLLLALNAPDARGPVVRLLGCKPMAALGLRSYGFYLYHQPILIVLLSIAPKAVAIPAALLITIALSALSWRYLETRFHQPRSAQPAPQVASVATL